MKSEQGNPEKIHVVPPAEGITQVYSVVPGQDVFLDMTTDEYVFDIQGQDLFISGDDGGIVRIEGLFAESNGGRNLIELSDGVQVRAEDFEKLFTDDQDFITGPCGLEVDPAEMPYGSGLSQFSASVGDLAPGGDMASGDLITDALVKGARLFESALPLLEDLLVFHPVPSLSGFSTHEEETVSVGVSEAGADFSTFDSLAQFPMAETGLPCSFLSFIL